MIDFVPDRGEYVLLIDTQRLNIGLFEVLESTCS